jgi:hypothetical protein
MTHTMRRPTRTSLSQAVTRASPAGRAAWAAARIRMSRQSSPRISAFDDLVDVDKRTKRALETGTHALERFSGTFILPSNNVSTTSGLSCA